MSYTNEVIRYFRQKDATGFNDPISWIGSEQRFVGPLRNSNINNLEEQYTLGTDTYTIYYEDEAGNSIIEKNFCIVKDNLDNVNKYYKVISTIYANPHKNGDIYFNIDNVNITNKYNDVVFGEEGSQYSDSNSIYFLNADKYYFDEQGNLKLTSQESSIFTELRKDELFFIKENNDNIKVLTKITETKISDDNKTIVRERIINHLK